MNEKKKVKTFSNCLFKLNIPKIIRFDDHLEISTSLTFRTEVPNSTIILYQARFIDRFGMNFDVNLWDQVYVRGMNAIKKIRFDIDLNGKHPSIQNAILLLQFMTNEGKIYELEYHTDDKHVVTFDGISVAEQDEIEQVDYAKILASFNDNQLQTKDTGAKNYNSEEESVSREAEFIHIPAIDEYKKALLREKYYLQKEGGRKYKVTDGKRLNMYRGIVTYTFDMESELFLSDDAPITLKVGSSEATGSVLVCEGFNISVMVDKDFGDTINSAMICVEPWKLLEAQVNRLDSICADDKLAVRLMKNGPRLLTQESMNMIPKGQEAAKKKIEESDITLIWGPPGTGKSYTMANVAIKYLQQGKKVLVVSHSNISVDGVVNQVVKQLTMLGKQAWLRCGRVLRYGYVRDENLAANRNAVAFNYTLDRNPDLKSQMDDLTEKKKTLKKTGGQFSSQMDGIEKELKKIRNQIRMQETKYVEKADMVATTISKAVVDHIFEDRKYDLVMFDEVSMAYVTQILCAAQIAKEKFVCVGDFNQLAPIAQSEAAKVLQVDVFSYLGIVDQNGNIHNHPWLVMLDEQRRMLPEISVFPSKYVYKNLLKNHSDASNNRYIADREPIPGKAMSFIDLSGTYCAADKNMDNSRYNIVSAIVSFVLAKRANKESGKDKENIGVITPYAAQARLIGAMVQDDLGVEAGTVSCATVHQFQGSERNMIIFDAVESYPGTQAGFLMSKNENRSLIRLINVAMTRARGKFIVVGNSQFWLKAFEDKNNFFVQLIKYLVEKCHVVKHANDRSLEDMLQTLDYGKNIRYYSEISDAITILNRDITAAKSKIVVSIPCSEMDMELNMSIIRALKEAKRNGITVNCKALDYEELAQEWKELTYASQNATFPLIVIDDSIVWYGMPVTKGVFHGKGKVGFVTVCHLCFRMKGKHTVDMIRSLTDIDMRLVDGVRKPFPSEKYVTNDNEKDMAEAGIHGYIQKYVKCSVCHQPTQVTRSTRGKVFLKCPSCKNMDFLTPEIVMDYVGHAQAVCPQCHAPIFRAGVSKVGIWCVCANGHYPSVDEI